jgi:hypothetical protein
MKYQNYAKILSIIGVLVSFAGVCLFFLQNINLLESQIEILQKQRYELWSRCSPYLIWEDMKDYYETD